MSSQLRLRRGSTTSHATFTGADGEVTFNTDTNALVTHDGATAGGFPHVKASDLAAPSGTSLVGYLPAGTGAVATTVQSKLRESVSVKDFGAVGDGVTDDTAAIQSAINYALTSTRKVKAPSGHYRVTSEIQNNGVTIEGDGPSTRFILSGVGNLFASGSVPSTGGGALIAAAVTAGSTTRQIQLASGGGVLFAPGTYAILMQEINSIPGSDTRDAEYIFIESVSADLLTIRTPTFLTYTTANTAKVLPVNLTENVGYKNFHIVMDDSYAIPEPASIGYTFEASGIYLKFCKKPIVQGVSGERAVSALVLGLGCVGARYDKIHAHDLYSDTYDKQYATGYAVCERALNLDAIVSNLTAERCRTAYTTVASPVSEFPYGHPTNTLVHDGIHTGSKSTGWDTHGTGINVTFSRLKAVGARRAGVQARSWRMNVFDIEATDVGGSAVAIFGGGSSNAAADHVQVRGVRGRNTNTYNGIPVDARDRDWRITGAVHSGCQTAKIEDVLVETCGGPLITEATLCLYPEYTNIRATGVQNLGIGTRGVETGNGATSQPRFKDVLVTDSPNVGDLIYRVNFSSKVELDNVKALGISGKIYASATGESGVVITGGFGAEMFSSAPANVTIVSDELRMSGVRHANLSLLPESGTVDTLAKITGAVTGGYVEVWGTAGNAINITHATGTDNLYLRGAVSTVLGNNQGMAFRRRGSLWYEIWRTF